MLKAPSQGRLSTNNPHVAKFLVERTTSKKRRYWRASKLVTPLSPHISNHRKRKEIFYALRITHQEVIHDH